MSSSTTALNESPIRCSSECLLRPGNTNCGGCGMSVSLTMLGRVLNEVGQNCTLVIPACCGIVTAGGYPTTSYNVPVIASTFGSCPAFGSGVAAVRDLNNDPEQVVCWAGDGGTYDIGFATLSAAAERNENLIYICYDNEIYGNTGGQRSSATPAGARTTTSPFGKKENKKDIMSIMAAHRIPYAATLSIAHPEDFKRKLKHALSISGFRFLLAHSPCPTGWKSEPADSVQLVRTAVNGGLFLLYEVYDGLHYKVNAEPDGETDPARYFEMQRRFPEGAMDFDAMRAECRRSFDRLKAMAERFPHEG
ncbi:MAG: pyruvate synthase subunit beta [Planctomycetes bacterium]|nr:pyruvate synthase subunit beta [Planctomycetota bacterium]NOG53884.1 pyruvate synthase subunit beta [Planctomycetota bacterium]